MEVEPALMRSLSPFYPSSLPPLPREPGANLCKFSVDGALLSEEEESMERDDEQKNGKALLQKIVCLKSLINSLTLFLCLLPEGNFFSMHGAPALHPKKDLDSF